MYVVNNPLTTLPKIPTINSTTTDVTYNPPPFVARYLCKLNIAIQT